MPRFLRRFHLTPLRIVVGLIVILVVLGLLWYFNRPSHKTTVTIPTITSSRKQQSSSPASNTSSNSQSTQTKSSITSGSTGSTVALVAPWGVFVSNHRPGENGTPTMENSSCNTSPGASCYIKFTNGDKTRTLPSQTTDANGSAIWSWDVTNAGFTTGSWQITAIATLNGQTKSTTDTQPLVIQ